MRNYYVEIPFRSNNYVFITYYVRWLLANEEDGMMIVITIGDNDHGDDDDDDDDDDNNDDGDDHDDVIKMETFSALLAILAGNSPVTGELPAKANDTERWCFFICAWINGRVNNRETGDLRRHHTHYDVIVMWCWCWWCWWWWWRWWWRRRRWWS